ncbi:MAG: hypothetical protein HYX40_13235 [Sphingobacteriales bacterium]|nr:hypothetical protein [Sphingobacteriales bacterium]
MKQLILLFVIVLAISCNNAGTDSKEPAKDTAASAGTTAAAPNYPYTIKHPDNWEIGSTANTMTALSALKAWEEGKMDASIGYFADSVQALFDGLDKKMSKDSLKAMFTNVWNSYKGVNIKMEDWESVISKDKSEEWVTLWYTQYVESKKGEKDSSAIINDIQLKDGKIIRLAEYTRKMH